MKSIVLIIGFLIIGIVGFFIMEKIDDFLNNQ